MKADIFKIILTNTTNDLIIIKVMDVVATVKSKYVY
jgi:hypothetical protein